MAFSIKALTNLKTQILHNQWNGGFTSNSFVLQLLADLLGKPVANIGMPYVYALLAALLAGLKIGIFESIESLQNLYQNKLYILPIINIEKALNGY